MTVHDLIALLEQADPGDPVEFVFQPNYPLTADLDRVARDPETATVHIILGEATGYADDLEDMDTLG